MSLLPFRSVLDPVGGWGGGLSNVPMRNDWQISDPFRDEFFSGRKSALGTDLIQPIAPLLSTDLVEKENEFQIMADLPGVDPNDLELCIENNGLKMKAERKHRHEVKNDRVHSLERSYGTVQRFIPMPRNADLNNAKVTFNNGELLVTVPKLEQIPESTKKLSINAA